MSAPGIDTCLDSLIFHEGEAPLLGLCERVRDGSSLADVGSLTWFDRSAPQPKAMTPARAVVNTPGHPIKLDDAPVPDFHGLPLDSRSVPTGFYRFLRVSTVLRVLRFRAPFVAPSLRGSVAMSV